MKTTEDPKFNASQLVESELLAVEMPNEPIAGDRVYIVLTHEACEALRFLAGTSGLSKLERMSKRREVPSMARRLRYLVQLGSMAVILARAKGLTKPNINS